MKVKIFPLAATPLEVELPDTIENISVKHIFSQTGTGRVFNEDDNTIMGVIQARHGSFENYGSVHVNGNVATLATSLRNGDNIMIVPRVQGGRLVG